MNEENLSQNIVALNFWQAQFQLTSQTESVLTLYAILGGGH